MTDPARLRRRGALAAVAAVVAAIDLVVKVWARAALDGRAIDVGPLDLRLGYNSGVAFSLGDSAPTAVIVGVTGAITLGIAVAAWRLAPRTPRTFRFGLAAVLGGAVANLVDRAADGTVTDYLHTGWWPTFNLADVAICAGGALLVLGSVRTPSPQPRDRRTGSTAFREAPRV